MIKILIADDHPIVRRGLNQIISESPDMIVGGEAQNGQEVLEKVWQEPWDVVVLDISMPIRNGLEVIREIKKEHPRLPVLVLSMHSEDQFAIRSLKAGAAGYLTKETVPDQLLKAIDKVYHGGRYVSETLAERLVLLLEDEDNRPPHDRLSNREFEVLCLLSQGKSSGQIAEELFLSVKTISTYRARILEKLQLHNTAELIQYGIGHKLI